MTQKSKQYFIQKFTKEIIKVWQECPSLVSATEAAKSTPQEAHKTAKEQ